MDGSALTRAFRSCRHRRVLKIFPDGVIDTLVTPKRKSRTPQNYYGISVQ